MSVRHAERSVKNENGAAWSCWLVAATRHLHAIRANERENYEQNGNGTTEDEKCFQKPEPAQAAFVRLKEKPDRRPHNRPCTPSIENVQHDGQKCQ